MALRHRENPGNLRAIVAKESNMRMWIVGLAVVLGTALVLAEPPKSPPAKPEPARGVEVTLDGLKSATPVTWKTEKPANLLRAYQFKLPHADGEKDDGKLFVLTTVHGTPQENIARLKELFLLPTDLPRDKAMREFEVKNAKATLTCLDIQGTYYVKNKPIDTAVKEVRPDYRMIAAVWMSKDAAYSIRLIGPKKTVEWHAKSFDQWLRSFK